nr:MAG TPA: hypothetical protein [Caudoviricetes sp.]
MSILKPRVLPWARSFCPFRAYRMQLTTLPLFIFVPPVSPSFRTFASETLK